MHSTCWGMKDPQPSIKGSCPRSCDWAPGTLWCLWHTNKSNGVWPGQHSTGSRRFDRSFSDRNAQTQENSLHYGAVMTSDDPCFYRLEYDTRKWRPKGELQKVWEAFGHTISVAAQRWRELTCYLQRLFIVTGVCLLIPKCTLTLLVLLQCWQEYSSVKGHFKLSNVVHFYKEMLLQA